MGRVGTGSSTSPDGVEVAVGRARDTAGDKEVGVGGANVAKQAIGAGLVDEVGVDLVPDLLGEGVRFFDGPGDGQFELERTRVVVARGVIHLRFRVVSENYLPAAHAAGRDEPSARFRTWVDAQRWVSGRWRSRITFGGRG